MEIQPTLETQGDNFIVWVFIGGEIGKTSGVFTSKAIAEEWIAKHLLSGTLRAYPLNMGVYDWAVNEGIFKPRGEFECSPLFIAGYVTASQHYYVYENGKSLYE
jgi:hypothetical protein